MSEVPMWIVEGLKVRAIFEAKNKTEAKQKYKNQYGFDWIYSVKEYTKHKEEL